MPAEHRVDPTTLAAVAATLTRASTAALDASHELVAHYGDTGDARTQRALDTLIDDAADTVGALADSLAYVSGEIQARANAMATTTRSEATTTRRADADGSFARTRPRQEHRG
jgi:hypothetical protein